MPLIDEPTTSERIGAYVGIVFAALCYVAVALVLLDKFVH